MAIETWLEKGLPCDPTVGPHTWEEYGFKRDCDSDWHDRPHYPIDQPEYPSPCDARRIRYFPYGDLDFLDLPAPPLAIGVGPFGVTFQCADGRLYYLTADGGNSAVTETWRVRAVG